MDPSRLGRLPPPFSFQPMQPLQEQQHEHQQHQQQGPSLHNSEEDEYSNSSGHNNNPGSMIHSVKGNGRGMRKSSSMADRLMGEGEVVRKPRGRPPGSKNKPKPPIIITRETGTGMRPHVLEIASGCDIHECIATFARRRQRSLCVLGASGTVSNVTLRQPTMPPGGPGGNSASVLTLHGRFDILSMSGTFMQPTPPPQAPQPLMPMPMPGSSPSSSLFGGGGGGGAGGSNASSPTGIHMHTCPSSGLTISLAGAQGQVIGGMVVGALMSVSPILVIAASFMGPCAERLPLDEHEVEHGNLLNGNGPPGGSPLPPHHLALTPGGGPPPGGIPPGSGGGGGGGGGNNVANDPCAMSLYNLPQVSLGHQMTPDILAWAAAAGGRPPPF